MEMRCLIIDSIHESIIEVLKTAGIQVQYLPEIGREEFIDILEDFEILIVRSKTPIDNEVLLTGKNLCIVARAGAGVDNIDVELATSRGISVINVPEANRDAVGDHCVGLLLALLNRIVIADRQLKEGLWKREENRGIELSRKIVAIIGYGNTGQAFAQRLQGFGCRVLAYDKYKSDYGEKFCEATNMERIFNEADILSLHVPLTAETRGLVSNQYIDMFSKPLYLINTARGDIVPLSSVVWGLQSGKLRGAALDVLECEKFSEMNNRQREVFDMIREFPNVVLTPHIAGWSEESYRRISEVLGLKILSHINKK